MWLQFKVHLQPGIQESDRGGTKRVGKWGSETLISFDKPAYFILAKNRKACLRFGS
jgi:hypothetical protein